MLSYTVIFSMSGRVSGRKVPVIISERKGHDTRIQYQQSCRLWQNISFIWYHHFWKYLPQVYMNCCLNCPSFDLNPQKGYVLETLGFSHDDRNTKCCAYMMARVQMCASPVLYFTISRIFCGQQESCVTYACTECIETWAEFLSYHLFSLPFFSSSLIRYFYFISQLHYKEHPVDYCLYICYLCGLFFFFPFCPFICPILSYPCYSLSDTSMKTQQCDFPAQHHFATWLIVDW